MGLQHFACHQLLQSNYNKGNNKKEFILEEEIFRLNGLNEQKLREIEILKSTLKDIEINKINVNGFEIEEWKNKYSQIENLTSFQLKERDQKIILLIQELERVNALLLEKNREIDKLKEFEKKNLFLQEEVEKLKKEISMKTPIKNEFIYNPIENNNNKNENIPQPVYLEKEFENISMILNEKVCLSIL